MRYGQGSSALAGINMGMSNKALAKQALTDARNDVIGLSHRIHAAPELAFAERRAAMEVADMLVAHGFVVHRGPAGLATALTATFGRGDFVVAVCAEYDALPDVGHACGHNMIAAAAVGAALALSRVADQIGVTVKLVGTPAEECGGGKILMLERGVFDGTHAVMAVHPGPFDADYVQCQPLACAELLVCYIGGQNNLAAARTAGSAILALGGLSAFESASHTIVKDDDPIVTAHCSLRSETIEDLEVLIRQATACAEQAAVAHDGTSSVSYREPPYSHFTGDTDLEACYAANLEMLGRVAVPHPEDAIYSTDLANVSLVIPTIHPTVGIDSGSAVPHDPEFTAACVSSSADAAVVRGATAMSWTAIDAATDSAMRARFLTR